MNQPSLQCPRCDKALSFHQTHGCTLAACSQCGGVWLNNQDAQRITAGMGNAIEDAATVAEDLSAKVDAATSGQLNCPVCKLQLGGQQIADVTIDLCGQHGTWFDRKELERVSTWFRQQIDAKRRGRQMAAAVATGAAVGGVAAVPGIQQQLAANAGQMSDLSMAATNIGGDIVDTALDVGVEVGADFAGAMIEGAARGGVHVASAVIDAAPSLLEGAAEVAAEAAPGILSGALEVGASALPALAEGLADVAVGLVGGIFEGLLSP